MEESPDESAMSSEGSNSSSSEAASQNTDRSLRSRVEEKYDFDNFTPQDMEEITYEEWEAVFDPDTWITGAMLLDRVEADLKSRVAQREMFAVIERISDDSDEMVLAYTDADYAVVYPDGSVDGDGSIYGEVKSIVALCSMEKYDVPEMPEGDLLPLPSELSEGSGDLGNKLIQVVAGVQVVAALILLAAPFLFTLPQGTALLTTVVGFGFIVISLLLLFVVANARLSDRFRAEEYRERLQAAGVGTNSRPDFLPISEDTDGGLPDQSES